MAKPFLKWAGGKRQLIGVLEKNFPPNFSKFNTYIEPFIGGGALLFHLLGKYEFDNVHISDVNPELVLCYRQIKHSVERVILHHDKLIEDYPENPDSRSEYFYEIRDSWNSNLDIDSMDDDQRCLRVARTLFLNKTCFNGLFRVNKSGKFNVPSGKYKNPSFETWRNLRAVSQALQDVNIHLGDYSKSLSWTDKKSFIYFDPPYRPLSKTSSFVSYSKGDFNDEDQKALALFTRKLDSLGHKFMLSNSDPKNTIIDDNFFDDLYDGFQLQRILASRAINSKADRRGKLTEILVTNYKHIEL